MIALFLLAALSAAEPAPNPYLAQAKVLYQGLEFEKALARLERAKTWKKNTVRDAAEISLYRGLCRYQQGDERAARAELRRALQLDATVELPPLTSPKIRAVFDQELAAIRPPGAPTQPADGSARAGTASLVTPAANAATTAPTAGTATTPSLTSPSAQPSLAPAALAPPPAKGGPALSKNHMPWMIAAGTATALAATGGLFGYSASRNASAANAAPFASDAIPLSRAAQQDATVANVLFGAAAVAAAAGVTLYFVF